MRKLTREQLIKRMENILTLSSMQNSQTISQQIRLFKRISNIGYIIYRSYPYTIGLTPVIQDEPVQYSWLFKFPPGDIFHKDWPFQKGG